MREFFPCLLFVPHCLLNLLLDEFTETSPKPMDCYFYRAFVDLQLLGDLTLAERVVIPSEPRLEKVEVPTFSTSCQLSLKH